jgi:hypothetical protein
MGCASSKPSSSTSTKANKKSKQQQPQTPAKSTSDTQITAPKKSNNSKKATNGGPAALALDTNGLDPTKHAGSSTTTSNNNTTTTISPLHLKQQAQAERAKRLAHPLVISEPLVHDIDKQRNRVITYLVTCVRRDLNNELITQNTNSNKLADLVMAASSATDNDDLIIDVVSRAVLLILNGTAGQTYKVRHTIFSFLLLLLLGKKK